jgi:TolB-like protein/thioredoxin-like negative regulator of GroEL
MGTGKLPFEGATSGLTYDAILNRGPTPPRHVNPNLPVELEQIINKALEKDREDRFQSAKKLMVDLKRLKRDTDSSRPGMPALPERPEPKKKSLWGWAAVVGLALIALALLFFWPSPDRDGAAIDSLAVLPFENTRNDPQVDYLSDGIAESLIDRLSQLPQLKVMARSTAFRYRASDVDPQTVGRELGVGAVLTGRVVQRDDTLNVHAELVDVESGRQLWGQSYDREMADIVSVQNDIAQEISQALRLQLSGEDRQVLAKSYTTNAEAYQAYLKGRFFWSKRTNEDFKKALEFFQEAREKDPEYALAQVGLADCYLLLGAQWYGVDEEFPPKETIEKARRAALEALRLDPSRAEARATLGFLKFNYDWDWQGSERDFQQAIALNPSYTTGHQWYGIYLWATGRHEEAIEEATHALELEPISPMQNRELGLALLTAERYPEAIEQLKKTFELDPAFPLTSEWLVYSYWLSGMEDEAVEEAKTFDDEVGRFYELVKEGKLAEATLLLPSLPDRGRLTLRSSYHILVGDDESLFDCLEEAFRERNPQLPMALGIPLLDPFRSDPRFQDLRQRMNLPE